MRKLILVTTLALALGFTASMSVHAIQPMQLKGLMITIVTDLVYEREFELVDNLLR